MRTVKNIFSMVLCVSIMSTTSGVRGQNLIPNGGFENYSQCPTANTQIALAIPWDGTMSGATTGPTPDFFHSCAGSGPMSTPLSSFGLQNPHGGDGYVGIVQWSQNLDDFREYLQVQLTEPLVADKCYELTLYVSVSGRKSGYATAELGAYFGGIALTQLTWGPLPVVPQLDNLGGLITDTLGWTEVSATFEAQGGEQYLVIGNFHYDASTTVVFQYPNPPLPGCYYFIDDVSLEEINMECTPLGVSDISDAERLVYPNPVIDWATFGPTSSGSTSVTVRDKTGRLVIEHVYRGTVALNLSHLPGGLYFFEMRPENLETRRGRFVKL